MDDVATRAGVSVTTVSRMLSGRRPVAVETRERIESVIAELGFRPNTAARALRMRRSHDIALILDNITHEANPMIARGAGRVLRSFGYNLIIYETDLDQAATRAVVDSVIDRGTDGAIVLIGTAPRAAFSALIDHGLPVIATRRPDAEWGVEETVWTDEEAGLALAASHVHASTSGAVAYIGGPEGDVNSEPRRRAFLQAAQEAGRPAAPALLELSPWSFDGGAAACERLLATGARFGGLVCANDLIAAGAVQSLRRHGLHVPSDVVVTGFDNIEAAALLDPALTTVDPFEIRLGELAATAMLARLEDGRRDDFERRILPALVVRASAPGH